jgi:hypothetical protein
MGDYAKVTRGKHLFGGVYETLVDGEPIGVTKQGRWNPWWTPEVRPALGSITEWTRNPFRLAVVAAAGIAGVAVVLELTKTLRARRGMYANPLSVTDARHIGQQLGIDWGAVDYGPAQLRAGIIVEQEHGPDGPAGLMGDVTHGDVIETAKIALAHLDELPDYYVRLAEMEARGECEA